ncbi:MAG TPA: UDP-N-acetylglucosamine 2-epimerase [Bacillota bacterium]|nr:UDP-N-acetylglucosamine 2-epimerase [Bacillota bacterium]
MSEHIKKIAVVTGTRAEYGLLYWVLKGIQADPSFDLQLIVTGMHLAPEFGLTYREIEKDGFRIREKVEMLLASDTPVGAGKSLGLGIIGFADVWERLSPDIIILLGDRFEILAAAQAALVARIPIAHIAGGDTTEGAFDEGIRHSISKMSHLHFVTNEMAGRRVRQLGEDPEHIYDVGSPGLDHLKRMTFMNRAELERELGFTFLKTNLLITFHPVTLAEMSSTAQFEELLQAVDSFGPEVGLIFTKPNADPGSHGLIALLENYVAATPNAKAYTSLGQLRYLSVMAQVDAVVGNSSSGLYEAPSFKKPTVNIGDRQKGRLAADSVIHCPAEAPKIKVAIEKALRLDCDKVVNPYGDGEAAGRIIATLKGFSDYKQLLNKHFFEVGMR